MLSVPQSSKWVAVELDAAVRVDKQFLSLPLSLFVVVVIVINVLQIILGGARAFFFSIRASISFSPNMQNTTSDWPIRVTFSFPHIKNVVFRDSLIDRQQRKKEEDE